MIHPLSTSHPPPWHGKFASSFPELYHVKAWGNRLDRIFVSPDGADEEIPASRAYQIDEQATDYAELTAKRFIADGVAHFRLTATDSEHFAALPRDDSRRDATAWTLWKKTSLPHR